MNSSQISASDGEGTSSVRLRALRQLSRQDEANLFLSKLARKYADDEKTGPHAFTLYMNRCTEERLNKDTRKLLLLAHYMPKLSAEALVVVWVEEMSISNSGNFYRKLWKAAEINDSYIASRLLEYVKEGEQWTVKRFKSECARWEKDLGIKPGGRRAGVCTTPNSSRDRTAKCRALKRAKLLWKGMSGESVKESVLVVRRLDHNDVDRVASVISNGNIVVLCQAVSAESPLLTHNLSSSLTKAESLSNNLLWTSLVDEKDERIIVNIYAGPGSKAAASVETVKMTREKSVKTLKHVVQHIINALAEANPNDKIYTRVDPIL